MNGVSILLLTVRRKLIRRSSAGFEIPRKPKLYKIERKGVPGVIDQISVDKNEKSITVANADNDRIDKGEGLGQFGKEKLKLSQIMMAVFVEKSKLNPKDLAIVRFALVSESDTKLAIEAAHKKLKIGEGGVVEVDSDSDDEKEEIFKDLKKTTLGKATEWLHKEFDAGEIKKIRITGGMQQGTMTIYLDD